MTWVGRSRSGSRGTSFNTRKGGEDFVGGQGQVTDGLAQSVEERAGDGARGGNVRRLTQGAHAGLALGVEHGLDVRNVLGPGDLVHLEIGVDHGAGGAVEDAVLKERERDTLDDRADD